MNILLAIVVFGYLTAAQGSLQDSFAKTWQLTIKTDRQSFIVGESVPVTAELKNASIKKELLMLPFGTEWGLLAYAAEKNTEPVVHTSAKRLKAMASDKRPPPAVWIGPQAVVQTKIWLAYDVRQRTVVFPKPGSYTIFMRFPYEEGVKSNVLTIDVKEPSGSDAKALEFLQQNKLTAYLDPDGKRLRPETEEAAKLKEFIKLYGTSIYAPVLRFALRDSGLAAQLTIYPLAGVDFDKLPPPPKNQAKTHLIMLENSGQETLKIEKIETPAQPFSFTGAPRTPFNLMPGQALDFKLKFQSPENGEFKTSIKIHSNDVRGPAVVTITGSQNEK